MSITSVLITGVGGQGSLLTSRILGTLALELGMDVKVSEVHGMAQRGGSVVTYVRMGDEVASPIIEEGGADYMLSFEMLEALRSVNLMKKNGKIVLNVQEIDPMPVIIGVQEYPKDIKQQLKSKVETYFVDALSVADSLGDARYVNTIMIGKLASIMGGDKEKWINSVKQCVPEKSVEKNILAFEKGYNL
ncbi:MAG: indolepyruvate oxidoreductase subunit beta [Clostridia bacterium]|nr:indolepyruvate oxidoreductase subunit beta [Clostridia bacterium]